MHNVGWNIFPVCYVAIKKWKFEVICTCLLRSFLKIMVPTRFRWHIKIKKHKGVFTWENSHRREFHTGISYFLISRRVYIMTGSFHISLFKGTFHVGRIHLWFKIANIMHVLPVPLYPQTDFTPKQVVVSRLHDTVARFAPRCENRGGLTPNR